MFTVTELHPDSALGFNVCGGEHLNFISSRNPDLKVGDTAGVKATEITSMLGSWIIKYECNSWLISEFGVHQPKPP
ncbi:MAG: hypothetical protein IKF59_11765, partial [Lachnospiraceae bacterium]|nr:hypothetical protein [Lachnospiraceae bacterium]